MATIELECTFREKIYFSTIVFFAKFILTRKLALKILEKYPIASITIGGKKENIYFKDVIV